MLSCIICLAIASPLGLSIDPALHPDPPLGWTSPPLQMNADDVRRVSELGAEMQREEVALSQLKAQMAGLEEQAAELQRMIDGVGEKDGP